MIFTCGEICSDRYKGIGGGGGGGGNFADFISAFLNTP